VTSLPSGNTGIDSIKKVPLVIDAVDTGDEVAGNMLTFERDLGGVEGSGTRPSATVPADSYRSFVTGSGTVGRLVPARVAGVTGVIGDTA
jgi:hypothetical protein